ncbi:MAG: threonylcarbamoyl-AMP synthase [Syntrophobacterales bacterium]|nr:threonylcarbamoyl-AMP synthase [Syntrophobacterales bacterium]
MVKILKLDPDNPDQPSIDKAADILREGGIIAYPTETFYGLGADAENEKAIEKIYTIKGRNFKNPISIIIGNRTDVIKLVKDVPETGSLLMNRFWPGGLTILFEASHNVPRQLTAGTGKIGIRLSGNLIATSLAKTFSKAVTATSANLSGQKECLSVDDVIDSIGNSVDAIIAGGSTLGGLASTIVDVTTDPPNIVREGVVPTTFIFDMLRKA